MDRIIVAHLEYPSHQVGCPASLAFAFTPEEKFSAIQDINGDGCQIYLEFAIYGAPGYEHYTLGVLLNDTLVREMDIDYDVAPMYDFVQFYTIGLLDSTLISQGINTIKLTCLEGWVGLTRSIR